MAFNDLLIIMFAVLGVVIAFFIVAFAWRAHDRGKGEVLKGRELAEPKSLPLKVVKTVSAEEAARAKEELRILDLEREILSDAIRKLYEAHAEGKITEEERERLAQTYKARMSTVKEAIAKDESLVALHELEVMQEDLIKLFSERFDEISAKIEELRLKVEAKPIKEMAITEAKPAIHTEEEAKSEEKMRRKRRPTPKPSPITEAEKRIEEIRAEVEKVLERLGQMEIEP